MGDGVYRITHVTHYRYCAQVGSAYSLAHLMPGNCRRQRCLDSDIEIDPPPRSMRHFRDYYGNTATYFDLHHDHGEMRVTVHSRVDVQQLPPALDERPWELVVQAQAEAVDEQSLMAREFELPSPLLPSLPQSRLFAEPSFPPGRPLGECLSDLMARIHQTFRYDPGATTVATPLAQVFECQAGVCQDFAHLMIAAVRAMGLPACYFSGYLETDPPPGQPRLVGADASHAWLGVYAPALGWMEFDPTNDCTAGLKHVRLAKGRDYGDVAPLKGVVLGGGGHQVSVSVDVCPV